MKFGARETGKMCNGLEREAKSKGYTTQRKTADKKKIKNITLNNTCFESLTIRIVKSKYRLFKAIFSTLLFE